MADTHWHLTHDGAEAPGPGSPMSTPGGGTGPITMAGTYSAWLRVPSPILSQPGVGWDGLCQRQARAHGWPGSSPRS